MLAANFRFVRLGISMRCLILLLVCSWVGLNPALSQDRDYGRSMVVTDHGIAATSHFLASQAGAQILSQGGTAIDAAIAANAALGVTEPMMNGIGGDLFLLYWDAKSGKLYGLNASGWAPEGLTVDFLKNRGLTSMPDAGIYSVTVPGAVDGWAKAHQPFPHNYSCIHGTGRRTHRIRNYGRFQSTACARAICVERRRLWMEYPGSAFRSTLHHPRHR
jgi:hypothetical protein